MRFKRFLKLKFFLNRIKNFHIPFISETYIFVYNRPCGQLTFDLLTCEGVFCLVHLTIGPLANDLNDLEQVNTSFPPVSFNPLIKTSLLTDSTSGKKIPLMHFLLSISVTLYLLKLCTSYLI